MKSKKERTPLEQALYKRRLYSTCGLHHRLALVNLKKDHEVFRGMHTRMAHWYSHYSRLEHMKVEELKGREYESRY